YLVSSISFEGVGDKIFENEETFSPKVLKIIADGFGPSKETVKDYLYNVCKTISGLDTLSEEITKFCILYNSKLVLLIDEVDKSSNNQLFLSFLGMLRNKYLQRNAGKDHTFHSVILAGVHDVKTLKLKIRPDAEQKYNSPWNIATEFKVDMSFNPQEISTMLDDYIRDKKVEMDIAKISERIYHYTGGYPFLVSRICKETDEVILPGKKENKWTAGDIDSAAKEIILERNTNFESLIKHLEENRTLYRYVGNLILGNKNYSYNALNLTINLGEIHGIFKNLNHKIAISNKIYEEVLTNYITSKIEGTDDITNDVVQSSYIKPDGRLNIEKVLLKFQEVIKEKYSKSDLLKSPEFLENDLRLLFLVFLKPVINGIGFSFKEVETSEEKRLDIVIIFRDEKFVVELKLWRGGEYHWQGIKRLKDYMLCQGVKKGYMLIMDKTRSKEFAFYEEDEITMVWV
ncbi:MAG: AAA family ATPase, partial [Bacteroidia bacterium]|nr:AAA family ATPase [Bacteroidia bacterium]